MNEETKQLPAWVLIALSILAASPIGATAKKVQDALADGKVTTPEFAGILAQAAVDAQKLVPGDAPEEQLAVDITRDVAAYLAKKFPPAPPTQG